MKRYMPIYALLIFIFLSSCKKDESVSFGTVEYYPSFLWEDSNITPVTKIFDFDFSQDAKDYKSFAEFQFVDNDGNPISTNIMQVTIDGKRIENNRFRINSNVDSIELAFTFSPKAEKGKHQGYLKLINHQLDRLDSQPLTNNQQVDAFQWTLNYDKRMNPLAKVLMWIGFALFALLVIWFLFFKPILYPRIRVNRIVISSKNGYFLNKNINGTRIVIFTNDIKRQNILNRFFTGEILYIEDSTWQSPWELTPKGRIKAVKIKHHGKYMVTPPTSELSSFGEYVLSIVNSSETFKIKLL